MPSKPELKALGERRNYGDRELTARDVAALSSDEYLWFQTFFPARLEHAAQIENNKRHNAEHMPTWNVRRMWGGGATADEDSAARIAGNQFALRCPQFQRSVENAQQIVEWMQAHDLDATKVESYVSAFQALVEEGKLSLAKPESADEFLASHSELHETRKPVLIQVREAKAQATAEHFAKGKAARAEAGSTSLTDYPNEQRTPPYSDIEKASLRAKVKNMSSSELAEKCLNDASFKKCLDSL